MIRDLPTWIHFAFLAIAFVGIFLADTWALAWIRGKIDAVHKERVLALHWVVTVGLSGLILSGLYLFWPLREYLLAQPLFWLKMLFVVTLLINSFFVERLMKVAMERPYSSLTSKERMPLFISGAVSTISWIGAITAAILLFKWPFV